MIAQLKTLRGYDPTPWLPTLTGAVIGSRAQSDAFLYEWRRTLADLLASEHYGTIAVVTHERGLRTRRTAYSDARPSRPLDRNPQPAVRYFSGTATYSGVLSVPRKMSTERLLLDPGKVGDVAQVIVNGHPAGIAWHAPYRVDITEAARPGHNRLEIRVAISGSTGRSTARSPALPRLPSPPRRPIARTLPLRPRV